MRRAGLIALLWAGLVAPAGADFSSSPLPSGLTFDGPVTAVATSGGKTYVGGTFNTVGPNTGSGLLYDAGLTTRDTKAPVVLGTVNASVPDGAGGWYVGGQFTSVGGVARTNVAHIKADDTVDTGFDSGAWEALTGSQRERVTQMVLKGQTLYIAGSFTKIGGVARRGVAALDAATGKVLPAFDSGYTSTNPPYGLAVAGGRVYISGFFSDLGTASGFNGLAELDATTGKPSTWRPGPTNNANVRALYASPDASTLYVACGYCTMAGNVSRPSIAAFSIPTDPAATPTLLPFNPEFYGNYVDPVLTMTQIGNTLYMLGRVAYAITTDGSGRHSVPRGNGIAYDLSGAGTLLPWDPKASGAILGSAPLKGKLLVAGDFQTFDGVGAKRVTVLDPDTAGVLVSRGINVTGGVSSVATDQSKVYVGGSIVTVDGTPRQNLAAFNADGTLAPFAGAVNATVRALTVAGGKLYVGGDFNTATGQGDPAATGRRHLASFDVADGSLTTFNPDIEGVVSTLASDAADLYVGGPLSRIKNVVHGNVAAFALGDDTPLAFDPAPDGGVNALALTGSRLYVGGSFGKLSGAAGTPARSNVAAFDLPALDLDTAFVPPAFDRPVLALAASDSGVFAGGSFSTIGGAARTRLAKLAPADGALMSWDAGVSDSVFALDLAGGTLYAGGAFGIVGGKIRDHAAALDPATAAPTSWNPAPDRSPTVLTHDATTLWMAGSFQNVAGVPVNSLAAFGPPGTGVVTVTPTPTATAAATSTGVPLTGSPSTAITGGPDAFTAATSVAFTFASDTDGATFQCSLDGADFAACTSPWTSPALAPGAHTFTVRAVGPDGTVDAGGATQAFSVLDAATGTPASAAAPGLRVKSKKKIAIGARKSAFRLRLAAPAYVEVVLLRKVRKKWRAAARLATVYRKAGKSRLKFNGTVAGSPLRRGRYRARITATGAGGATVTRTVAFKLVPARRGHKHHKH